MTSENAADKPADDKAGEAEAPRTLIQRVWHEARETLLTIAVFVPFWLVFSTFVYELRSIPSESMIPALQVGDRVAVAKFAYGYNRNSIPFSIGTWFMGDDPAKPEQRWFGGMPQRGDVVVFQHPHNARVMIKRCVGLPGDKVQVKAGRLYINGAIVERQQVRVLKYVGTSSRNPNLGEPHTATEYREHLPDEKGDHLIHEFGDNERLDWTPEFVVPAGHVFMMGDNRDNSEDSRAPSGHPDIVARQKLFEELHRGDINQDAPPGWRTTVANEGWDEQAIGFVPVDHLIGRADTVLFTLYGCKATAADKRAGYECAAGRWLKGL